jgi:prepilin-type N-terminal cleavage/methylation domain-containing protein
MRRLRHAARSHIPPTLRREHGFTLIELLVAMLVGGIVLAAGATALILAYHSSAASASRTEIASAAEVALERLTDDVRDAAATCSTSNGLGNGITVTIGTGTTEIEMCDPASGQQVTSPSSSLPPGTNVVAWYCDTAGTTDTCGRYVATSASAISTDITGQFAPQTTIHGVQSVTLTGTIASGSGSPTGANFSAGTTTYPLVASSGTSALSWLGISLSLLQLRDPSAAGTATVPDTAPFVVSTGIEPRNFQA